MYNVQTLKTDLASVLHGTTINQITNINGVINRAARQLLQDLDPQETKRILPISNGVFTTVYDYPCPVDVKGNKIIDISPQVNRVPNDLWLQIYNQIFDSTKQISLQNNFTMNFNTGIKALRINAPFLPAPIVVNYASSITQNGTWVTGGGATNLTVNNVNFVTGGGALQFNLAAASFTGFVENSTMTSVNLINHLNQANEFFYTFLPTGSAISAVEYRWGSSATDYYVASVSLNQELAAFQNGWNLLDYVWKNATVVGAPDPSNITYQRVTYTYDGTLQTAVKLNALTSNLGAILNLEYYSKFLFRDNITGAFQENVTDDSNIVNLDTDSYNILFNQVAYLAVQQQQGLDANFYDGNFFLQNYLQGIARYKAMYKSEVQKPASVYYAQPRPGYNSSIPWWGLGR